MSATTRSIIVSAPDTNGSCTNPTRGSSNTHMPRYLYGAMTFIAFIQSSRRAGGAVGVGGGFAELGAHAFDVGLLFGLGGVALRRGAQQNQEIPRRRIARLE